MDSPTYLAKRFWSPRPTTDDSFVGDLSLGLDSRRFRASPPVQEKKPLDALLHIPCLILLGELGLGKTEELKRQENSLKTSLAEVAWRFDLSGFQSEGELRSALTQDPLFSAWLAGAHPLHLFLDSFDEALLTLPVLPKLLPRVLGKYREHLHRLSLRIACRTADWRKSYEDDLKKFWDSQNIEVYQLLPLDSEDVRVIARAALSTPDHFLAEIDRKGVMPLASRPITLRFLLDLYQENGYFPGTKQQLYLEGCTHLCTESEERRDAGTSGKLLPEQRLLIAGRLALLSLVTHRPIVWMDIAQKNALQSNLALSDCFGEPDESGIFIDERALRETLATGLFSSRGQKRLGWSHRSYAEFLAAYYLVSHQCPAAQVMNLLVHPDDKQHKLDPRLHEIAAWCALLQEELFLHILSQEPEVLLRSDLIAFSDQEKEDLLTALLCTSNPGELWYIHQSTLFNRPEAYKNLVYPGLAEQLRPYILDKKAEAVQRLTAISIAHICELSLQEEFIHIATDSTERLDIRNEAAQALIQVGDTQTKAKLKPLLFNGLEDDPDDELKASFLRACWPGVLSAPELFALLTPAKNEDVAGAYYRFLASYVPEYIAPEELPTAFEWITQYLSSQRVDLSDGRTRAANALLLRAVEHLDTPEIRDSFVNVLIVGLATNARLLDPSRFPGVPSLTFPNEQIRYHLLNSLIHRLAAAGLRADLLVAARPPFVFVHDLPWLFEEIKQEAEENAQQFIAQLVRQLTNRDDPEQMEAIRVAGKQLPSLASVHTQLSEKGTHDVSLPLFQEEKDQPQEADSLVSQPENIISPLERIAPLVDAFGRGDSSVWPHIAHQLRVAPDGTWSDHNTFDLDVTARPGWSVVERALGREIKGAAKTYIEKEEANDSIWQSLDGIHFHSSALAYAQAFHLLFQTTPDVLPSFSPRAWGRLALALFAYAALNVERSLRAKSEEANLQLISQAYQHAPTEVIASLLSVLEKEAWESDYTYPRILQQITLCRDEQFNRVLLTSIQDPGIAPKCVSNILNDLLLNSVEQARTFVETLLSKPFPVEEQAQARVVHAAFAFLTCMKDAGWAVIWPKFLLERAFALQLIGIIYHGNAAEYLTEKQIADLYVWLVREYPASKYPTQFEGFVGAVEPIAWLRDNLLNYLRARGTFQACEALEYILQELPPEESLPVGWMLADTHLIARQHRSTFFRPQELLKVVQNERKRLVQNEYQLLLVILESLEQLDFKLHENNNPALRDIWDHFEIKALPESGSRRKKKAQKEHHIYRPIDENEFSDYVKRHLEADLKGRGIVANREVVISPENRIDIRIDAMTFSKKGRDHDIVSVIIEAKGCWNAELQTSMKEQLAERYLKNNRCHHGLYLVGWFHAQAWKGSGQVKGDSKRCLLPRMTVEEAQFFFDNQAKNLSQAPTHIRAFVLDATLPAGYGASSSDEGEAENLDGENNENK